MLSKASKAVPQVVSSQAVVVSANHSPEARSSPTRDYEEEEDVDEIVDEYDPARPNDYETLCQLRRQRQLDEERQQRLKERMTSITIYLNFSLSSNVISSSYIWSVD